LGRSGNCGTFAATKMARNDDLGLVLKDAEASRRTKDA
jgi:hypothetical protein